MSKALILTILFAFFASNPALAKDHQQATLLKVFDGDTILVRVNKKEESVRLLGIDCYETYANNRAYKQAYTDKITVEKVVEQGLEAKYYVQKILKPNDTVFLETEKSERDKYGRLLAYVYLKDGTMLNKLLLKNNKAKLFIFPTCEKRTNLSNDKRSYFCSISFCARSKSESVSISTNSTSKVNTSGFSPIKSLCFLNASILIAYTAPVSP